MTAYRTDVPRGTLFLCAQYLVDSIVQAGSLVDCPGRFSRSVNPWEPVSGIRSIKDLTTILGSRGQCRKLQTIGCEWQIPNRYLHARMYHMTQSTHTTRVVSTDSVACAI